MITGRIRNKEDILIAKLSAELASKIAIDLVNENAGKVVKLKKPGLGVRVIKDYVFTIGPLDLYLWEGYLVVSAED